jgi:hypothetical protein
MLGHSKSTQICSLAQQQFCSPPTETILVGILVWHSLQTTSLIISGHSNSSASQHSHFSQVTVSQHLSSDLPYHGNSSSAHVVGVGHVVGMSTMLQPDRHSRRTQAFSACVQVPLVCGTGYRGKPSSSIHTTQTVVVVGPSVVVVGPVVVDVVVVEVVVVEVVVVGDVTGDVCVVVVLDQVVVVGGGDSGGVEVSLQHLNPGHSGFFKFGRLTSFG